MAQLHVQPKRQSYWWLWLLLLIAIAAVIIWYINDHNKNPTRNNTKISLEKIYQASGVVSISKWRLSHRDTGWKN